MKNILVGLFLCFFCSCTEETYIQGIDSPVKDLPVQDPFESDYVEHRAFRNAWRGTYLNFNGTNIYLTSGIYRWRIEKLRVSNEFLIIWEGNGDTKRYLSVIGGELKLSSTIDNSAKWLFEPVNGATTSQVYILNTFSGGYLHAEYGSVSCGDVLVGWLSSRWGN